MTQYYWTDSDKVQALSYKPIGTNIIPVTDEEAEELCECLMCMSMVPTDLARCHDAGWICECCADNGGP